MGDPSGIGSGGSADRPRAGFGTRTGRQLINEALAGGRINEADATRIGSQLAREDFLPGSSSLTEVRSFVNTRIDSAAARRRRGARVTGRRRG